MRPETKDCPLRVVKMHRVVAVRCVSVRLTLLDSLGQNVAERRQLELSHGAVSPAPVQSDYRNDKSKTMYSYGQKAVKKASFAVLAATMRIGDWRVR